MEPPDDYVPTGIAIPVCIYSAAAPKSASGAFFLSRAAHRAFKGEAVEIQGIQTFQNTSELDVVEQAITPLLQEAVEGVNVSLLCGGSAQSPHVAVFQGEDPPATPGLITTVLGRLLRLLDAKGSVHFVRISFVEFYEETIIVFFSSANLSFTSA
ncbi:hypothetical protein ACHHYP_20784 [Achlya hypogyna]|uniref:Kinesin motor domain-containing protein n=1 Tax=Achlya hypogyna TaxID=1202772 RepID=A0A1V9ZEH8_ACHHY|nr:hypothetical protein ACHHYP_20784 [Achlya hypogyna]